MVSWVRLDFAFSVKLPDLFARRKLERVEVPVPRSDVSNPANNRGRAPAAVFGTRFEFPYNLAGMLRNTSDNAVVIVHHNHPVRHSGARIHCPAALAACFPFHLLQEPVSRPKRLHIHRHRHIHIGTKVHRQIRGGSEGGGRRRTHTDMWVHRKQ